ELEAVWEANERLGPLQRWMGAVEHVIRDASSVTRPAEGPALPGRPVTDDASRMTPDASLVIFIDEIDAVRSLPFSTDEFFAAIRECYNRRSEEPAFRRLTFCLLGV